MKSVSLFTIVNFVFVATFCSVSNGQDTKLRKAAEDPGVKVEKIRREIVAKGLKFLAEQGQAENGSFTERAGAGITALAGTSALRNGKTVDDPMVAKGLKALEAFVNPTEESMAADDLRTMKLALRPSPSRKPTRAASTTKRWPMPKRF